MCLATNRASGTVRSNRSASSPGVPPLLVTSKIWRSTSSEPAPLPVKTSIRSICGVSIGTKPNPANVWRKTASIRSRGIITAGGRSLRPLATRGSIMERSLSQCGEASRSRARLARLHVSRGRNRQATPADAIRLSDSQDSTIPRRRTDLTLPRAGDLPGGATLSIRPVESIARTLVRQISQPVMDPHIPHSFTLASFGKFRERS